MTYDLNKKFVSVRLLCFPSCLHHPFSLCHVKCSAFWTNAIVSTALHDQAWITSQFCSSLYPPPMPHCGRSNPLAVLRAHCDHSFTVPTQRKHSVCVCLIRRKGHAPCDTLKLTDGNWVGKSELCLGSIVYPLSKVQREQRWIKHGPSLTEITV